MPQVCVTHACRAGLMGLPGRGGEPAAPAGPRPPLPTDKPKKKRRTAEEKARDEMEQRAARARKKQVATFASAAHALQHLTVVLDPLLVDQVAITEGLKQDGIVIINSSKTPEEFSDTFKGFRVATVPAGRIAVKHRLGSHQSPIVNTAILGAVAKVLGIVTMESLIEGIKTDVPAHAEDNAAAARDAYESVTEVAQL